MKDDPKFNILFVQEVEKHPELYDPTMQAYTNKNEQEKHWQMIAEVLNESNTYCKEKWKNLRSSLCRHLRNQSALSPGMRCKKSYYLAKYLDYLVPFIKLKQADHYINSLGDRSADEERYEGEYEGHFTPEMEMVEGEESHTPTDMQSEHQQPEEEMSASYLNALSPVQELHELPVKKRKLEHGPPVHSFENLIKEYFVLKSEVESKPENPDLLFLKSLLPEMQKMEAQQKIKFKMMILQGLDEILYKSAPDSHSDGSHGTPNAQRNVSHCVRNESFRGNTVSTNQNSQEYCPTDEEL